MPAATQRIHETDFCAEIAHYAKALFEANPAQYTFSDARIEGFGSGATRRRRKDLRFFDQRGRLSLTGEVKFPGTREGRSPYDESLIRDAAQKAEEANIQYFFTWNVNLFVLWDRSLWDRPLLERRVRQWRLDHQASTPEEAARADTLLHIRNHFLPQLLRDLSEIVRGKVPDWAMPPDEIFIRSLESHLDWPVDLTRQFILDKAAADKKFDSRICEWMSDMGWSVRRNDPVEWKQVAENTARTLCYIWANRLIFYKALKARFRDLPKLEFKTDITTPLQAKDKLHKLFLSAFIRTGDYQPLLFPYANDWALPLVFEGTSSIEAWRGLIKSIDNVDFGSVSSDVVGRVFQRLISPEERHQYGQHFTEDDPVDLINAFCVQSANDTVLDPACGSGSFLVRAYYRKRSLSPSKAHRELISELFGCDIALYPAHLAMLNLAAREINDEANYPRIERRDFFEVAPDQPFTKIPASPGGAHQPIYLPSLDAVVANPPYVRQEKVDKKDKKAMARLIEDAWDGLRLSGRADLHCYFWPAAARFLKPDGYLGFLTSSSWLDVEYGFALQEWMLRNFKIIAIMESAAEPWFPDARVKTCITILKRCAEGEYRMSNLVKFVRFEKPLADLIGVLPMDDEVVRQRAVDQLRAKIQTVSSDSHEGGMRIIVKRQSELWEEGVRAGKVIGNHEPIPNGENDEEEDEPEVLHEPLENFGGPPPAYKAGKWGRYLRAPDFYFDVMHRFGHRFSPLGSIVDIRRGITSGCDDFFMPHDITTTLIHECRNNHEFKQRSGGASKHDAESGLLKIVQAGDGSVHPIESQFVAPELHSLMQVDRPIVKANTLDRVVLLVSGDKSNLKGTWALKYLKYGEQTPFPSRKSKPLPVPERSTCAARSPWYDLTPFVKPGFALWPKSQQYRHIAPANEEAVIANCNLYDISSPTLSQKQQIVLVAILNSTMVALFKSFYGRYAGTEGNLKTEIVDVNLLEIPDPRNATKKCVESLSKALRSLQSRPVGHLVEEQLMDCHSPEDANRIAQLPVVLPDELKQPDRRDLDDAVFQLLGVTDPNERTALVDKLYYETALHFREIRVVEIQKMEQRRSTDERRHAVEDLAKDAWDAVDLPDVLPLTEWISDSYKGPTVVIDIPEARPAAVSKTTMFNQNTVYFGKDKSVSTDFHIRAQAEIVATLANLGISGPTILPATEGACSKLQKQIAARLEGAKEKFKDLSSSRTNDDRIRTQMVELLMRWFILGHPIQPDVS